ncbi:MFS transporter [Bradyrhizobium arachidis]|uniref:MFS transporter n=2 Tax=Nitrobacteraceae TaxID=41294 RepID=UPI003D31DA14
MLMLLSPLPGFWLSNVPSGQVTRMPIRWPIALTARSGTLVVEIEYHVPQENARAFHNVMQGVQLLQQRNGAYGWSIARDIANPELWTERYQRRTWLDYLRQRNLSDSVRACARKTRRGFPSWSRLDTRSLRAGAPIRIGAMTGRRARQHCVRIPARRY